MAVLGLSCWASSSLAVVSGGSSYGAVASLVLARALAWAPGVVGSAAVAPRLSSLAHRLSCSEAEGSSRTRDWTHLLHWQADSSLLSHQGKPSTLFLTEDSGPGFDPWGWEDPLEMRTPTHSSILTWGPQRVGHNWVTFTSSEMGSSC